MKKISELSSTGKIITATLQVLFVCLLIGASLFISAGRVDWIGAWVFIVIYGLSSLISTNTLFLSVPELMGERKKKHSDIKKWDKLLVLSYQIMYFPILILSGFDEHFGCSDVTSSTIWIARILVLLSFILMTWAPLVNRHLETYIRIQKDREHNVCDKGPYRYIRHPAYSGLILLFISIPVSLGSWLGLIPALVAVVLVSIRTFLEDTILKKELPGYKEYSNYVRYRLIPRVW